MAKKMILLLLIIPIVVMILLFAATETLSNLVPVPVSKIEIIGEERHVYLNIDKGETHSLEYAVYPTTAKNKKVSVSTEAIEGKNLAELSFEVGDGNVTIIPQSVGSAKVILTTVDGGFQDSIAVHVDSTMLKSIDATIPKNELTVGEAVVINTVFQPNNPADARLRYESSNPSVATVSASGIIRALRKGTAEITVFSKFNESITDTITVVVKNADVMDLGETEITSFFGKGSIPISIESDKVFTVSDFSYQIFDKNGNEVPASVITAEFVIEETTDGQMVTLDYAFQDESFVGDIRIDITFGTGNTALTKSCTVSKTREIGVSFVDEVVEVSAAADEDTPGVRDIFFTLTPADIAVTYEVSTSNDNIKVQMGEGESITILAYKAGLTEITLTVTGVEDVSQVKTITTTVVILPRSLTIEKTSDTIGIENLFTIGGYEFDYSTKADGELIKSAEGQRAFSLNFSTPSKLGKDFDKIFNWRSSSSEVLIDKNGVISFANDTFSGDVTFSPSVSYEGVELKETGSYTIRCVAEGINVYSYPDLYYATKAEKPIVLHSDIKEGFGKINGQTMYTEIDTTYDKTYYSNIGKDDEAKVKILLEFKNDIFGNGHIINAHEITYKLIKKDNNGVIERTQEAGALFNGPLDFVRAVAEGDGVSTISVKAQDNICFALYEGVTVNNVELRGCNLEGDETGKQDLVDLNYIGTTVEVLGDNVVIAYSRITNGRTVLRAFGDIDDAEQKIHLRITNSVLSGAREFIMRIGSNRFVNGVDGNISPNLTADEPENVYDTKKTYHTLTPEEKAAYDERYINTFVTVRNSIFKDAGLFAIGMDSHFAGGMLHFGKALGKYAEYLDGWNDLAKTSYGAKLYFELGEPDEENKRPEVGLYSWKPLKDVDSSTLIEIVGTNEFFKSIELNLQEMIEKAGKKDRYKDILTSHNGEYYVHSGIAFFGGGKNYSIFDSESNISLGRYEVSLSDVDKGYLKLAAGEEDFYFFIYDKTSTLTPALQETKLNDKSAYECIYKK